MSGGSGHGESGGGLTKKDLTGAMATAVARFRKAFGRNPTSITELNQALGEELGHLEHDLVHHEYPQRSFAESIKKSLDSTHPNVSPQFEANLKEFLRLGEQVHAKIKWNEDKIKNLEETTQRRLAVRKSLQFAGTKNVWEKIKYGWRRWVRGDKTATPPVSFSEARKASRERRISTGLGLWKNPVARQTAREKTALEEETAHLQKLAKNWKGYLDEHQVSELKAKNYTEKNLFQALAEHNRKTGDLINQARGTAKPTQALEVAEGEAARWQVGLSRRAQNALLRAQNRDAPGLYYGPLRRIGWAVRGVRKPGQYVPPALTEHGWQLARDTASPLARTARWGGRSTRRLIRV